SLSDAKAQWRTDIRGYVAGVDIPSVAGSADQASSESFPASDPPAIGHDDVGDSPRESRPVPNDRPHERVPVGAFELDHGAVVIAAITSCTNTSNPQVMLGAAL